AVVQQANVVRQRSKDAAEGPGQPAGKRHVALGDQNRWAGSGVDDDGKRAPEQDPKPEPSRPWALENPGARQPQASEKPGRRWQYDGRTRVAGGHGRQRDVVRLCARLHQMKNGGWSVDRL